LANVDKQPSIRFLPARSRILIVRDQQVMLDADLAELYGVETRTLLQQVKRNSRRFPDDFMFQLSAAELEALRSQFVMSKSQGRGGRRTRPYAFTEQGVAMLSSVLRSDRAVAVNIEIMRAFVEMRRTASSYAKLAMRMEELERTTAGKLGEHEQHLAAIFKALKQLMAPSPKRKHPVGFRPSDEN
jgi:phage regulator Rha-like protein